MAGQSFKERDVKTHTLFLQVNQRVMSKQLESAGHRVYLANHGGECLDFIKGSRFCKSDGLPLDVILLGLEMPVSLYLALTSQSVRLMKISTADHGRSRSHPSNPRIRNCR